MLATPGGAHNEAAAQALTECLDDVRPLLDSRRLALLVASVLALGALVGIVPLHTGIALLIAAMSSTAVVERRLVMRAGSPDAVRLRLWACAFVYATQIMALW